MTDYYPFVIGALFGFGAGYMVAYLILRVPTILRARKAAKTRAINKVKKLIDTPVSLLVAAPLTTYNMYSKEFPNEFKNISYDDWKNITFNDD